MAGTLGWEPSACGLSGPFLPRYPSRFRSVGGGQGRAGGPSRPAHLLPRASPCPLGSLHSPSRSPGAPPPQGPGMPSALSSLRGQPRGQLQWALVASAGGRAALTGSSPALGAIVCPPSCQPSFHLLKCVLKCKSSPVVLLPTALPRSHGSQLRGRRLNSSANVPAAPLHPTASASAWPPLLRRPLPVLSPGWGVWADGSLSRKMPSPPAQPQPLASSSGCVLCVGGGGTACY